MPRKLLSVLLLFVVFHGGTAMAFTLISPAFKDNTAIPSLYTCDDKDMSPALQWQGAPAGTKTFALIMDDPDAPKGWDHWLLFNIPSDLQQLPVNLTSLPQGLVAGKNSWGHVQYNGPCPPEGEHRYVFKLFALDVALSLPSGASRSQLEHAMQGHILGTAALIGRYQRR